MVRWGVSEGGVCRWRGGGDGGVWEGLGEEGRGGGVMVGCGEEGWGGVRGGVLGGRLWGVVGGGRSCRERD